MREYNYGVNGKDRKALVAAVSDILGTESKYHAAPNYEYTVGDYTVTRDGTLVGPEDISLIAWLAQKGFELETQPEAEPNPEVTAEPESITEADTAPEPEAITKTDAEPETTVEADATPELETTTEAEAAPEPETIAEAETAPEAESLTTPDEFDEPDRLTIEYPLKDITDEVLTNLRKMVAAKAPLLKKAFGAEELPIFLTEHSLKFPWFSGKLDGDTVGAYAQFIACLCETAKRKKRVTAQTIDTDNARFSMRVWLISLGMIGAEFGLARKLLYQNLDGDSGWRYGKPEKAKTHAETMTTTDEAVDAAEAAETAETADAANPTE